MKIDIIDFINLVEKTKIKNGTFPNIYKVSEELNRDFMLLFRQQKWQIMFDWVNWDEGRVITRNKTFDYTSIDLETKCKLLTAIVRNDRFHEGAIKSSLNSGLIITILKSM
ncbi:DUF6508 domain-containing protein [Polaribacter sp.]|uniref:DUF6508 domain-containing protein n=1 Tax=Polaribacter sp. TaxID=1920175 RepID=UPI003EF489FA